MELAKIPIVLALHAHLPYVRIPDKKFPLQELWLYQALTESYIPIILCLNSLIEDNIEFNITLSISPTLISMLCDDYFKSKYTDYLKTLIELLEKKLSECESELQNALLFLLNRIRDILNFYFKIECDLINEIKKLSANGKVNLITTSATHSLFPLLRFSNNLIKRQIGTGLQVFNDSFGFIPEGFWLPEMGYFTNLDNILRTFKIKYTFLEAHSVYLTEARPSYGNFYPSKTNSGLIIFPRDLPLSNAIWSSKFGYPGDNSYREFHYDFTYSLSDSELNEFGIDRIPFGLKIYKITGNEKEKEFYNNENAMKIVKIHSEDFVNKIKDRAAAVKRFIGRTPLFTLPFDAELFGHWWYEGPEFLKQIIIEISKSDDIKLTSPDINDKNIDLVVPAESSWGREGFFKSWTSPDCSWIYPELAKLDLKLFRFNSNNHHREYRQALKEIMLASASDWTFMISNESSADYAKMRLNEHINAAKQILSGIELNKTDETMLSSREESYPIFNK